jgi:type IV pilus assembly protein PilQ
MKKRIDIPKNLAVSISLFMLMGMLFGCATDKTLDVEVEETRRITTIKTSENDEAVYVFIRGNQNLEYTAMRMATPRGVLVDFPDTGLENLKSVYTPPENDIISSIKIKETLEDQTKQAQLFIALKAAAPYDLDPIEGGVKISFSKANARPLVEMKPLPEIPAMNLPVATQLEAVTATPLKNKLIVNVKADGTIKEYTSFTLDSPPRIVVDIFNLQSPYENEQKIAVDSKWVDRVRHCVHPDKVRVVLDTHQGYLSEIETYPTNSGILIYVRDNH